MTDAVAHALQEIRAARPWPVGAVENLEELVRTGTDRELFRANPYHFAERAKISETDAIELMLFASRAGLFEMKWTLICPMCAIAVDSFATLRSVTGGFYCSVCKLQTKTDLDAQVQVGFTVSPKIRKSKFHTPLELTAFEYVNEYRFSTRSFAADGTPMHEVIGPMVRMCEYLEAGQTLRRTIQVNPGALGLSEVIHHRDFAIQVSPTGSNKVTARMTPEGFKADVKAVAPGQVELELINETGELACSFAINLSAEMLATARQPAFERYLTGSRLLASHAFRQLFRTEVIKGAEGLGVKEVTLLFTDLKGSTAMYERIGDLQAFSLVRTHFDRLATAIQANNGAVVKTIGDAVMAVFVSPLDAVKAALRMQGDIEKFNRQHGGRELILKIGIHAGATIAVTLNENLDYFGQTVNVAARVQAHAEADEICLTEEAYRATDVAAFLSSYPVSPELAQLKGVQREVKVYRVRPDVAAMAA